jgi:hypothetical protein
MRASERIFLMAGPLSSEEIEDVVSSVRRLVSNEQRPRNLSRDLNSERLLLTPAQRVMPETSPLAPLMLDASLLEAQLAEAALTRPSPDPAVVMDETLPVDQLAAVPADADAVALMVVPDDPDPDVNIDDDLLATVDPEPTVDPELAADLAEATLEEPQTEWEDELWVEPAAVSLGEAALAAEEAEVLTGPSIDDEMSDGAATDDRAESWAQADLDPDGVGPIPFVPLRRRAEHLAARLAAGEVVETPRPEAATDVIAISDATPADAERAIAAENELETGLGRQATEFVDADGMQLDVLDEQALQEIVRQTLRAELQGELGERITRNVRKLVRAEINRALMARDLD